MKNKDGSAGLIIFFSILLIIILAIVITIVAIIIKKDNVVITSEQKEGIELFIKIKNVEDISGDYIVTALNGTILSSGKSVAGAYSPTKIGVQNEVFIYCWNNENYIGVVRKNFDSREKNLNLSKVTCNAEKIGNLQVDFRNGDLSEINNKITFNISSSDGSYNKIGVCYSWSAGILEVNSEDKFSTCKYGSWKNYSSYDPKTKVFQFLEEGKYICGNEIQFCDYVFGDKCNIAKLDPPNRFGNSVDRCEYLGFNLKDGNGKLVSFMIKTLENKNQLDNIKFTFFDSITKYDPISKKLIHFAELNNKDVGGEDQQIIIYND